MSGFRETSATVAKNKVSRKTHWKFAVRISAKVLQMRKIENIRNYHPLIDLSVELY